MLHPVVPYAIGPQPVPGGKAQDYLVMKQGVLEACRCLVEYAEAVSFLAHNHCHQAQVKTFQLVLDSTGGGLVAEKQPLHLMNSCHR